MLRPQLIAALLIVNATQLVAQQVDPATVGIRAVAVPASAPTSSIAPTPQDSAPARRSIAPYLLIGALVGGVIGLVLEEDFHDDFCTPGEGVTCSSSHEGIGMVIGAGLGMLGGLIVYAISEPPARPPPAPSAHRTP